MNYPILQWYFHEPATSTNATRLYHPFIFRTEENLHIYDDSDPYYYSDNYENDDESDIKADIDGTAGNDKLHASKGGGKLSGYDGDDLLIGRASNDEIYGGLGDDILYGQIGSDQLYGGLGNDILYAEDEKPCESSYMEEGILTYINVLDGGPGDDVLIGGYNVNKINAQLGNDVIIARGYSDCTLNAEEKAVIYIHHEARGLVLRHFNPEKHHIILGDGWKKTLFDFRDPDYNITKDWYNASRDSWNKVTYKNKDYDILTTSDFSMLIETKTAIRRGNKKDYMNMASLPNVYVATLDLPYSPYKYVNSLYASKDKNELYQKLWGFVNTKNKWKPRDIDGFVPYQTLKYHVVDQGLQAVEFQIKDLHQPQANPQHLSSLTLTDLYKFDKQHRKDSAYIKRLSWKTCAENIKEDIVTLKEKQAEIADEEYFHKLGIAGKIKETRLLRDEIQKLEKKLIACQNDPKDHPGYKLLQVFDTLEIEYLGHKRLNQKQNLPYYLQIVEKDKVNAYIQGDYKPRVTAVVSLDLKTFIDGGYTILPPKVSDMKRHDDWIEGNTVKNKIRLRFVNKNGLDTDQYHMQKDKNGQQSFTALDENVNAFLHAARLKRFDRTFASAQSVKTELRLTFKY
jgi:hypothetical protein